VVVVETDPATGQVHLQEAFTGRGRCLLTAAHGSRSSRTAGLQGAEARGLDEANARGTGQRVDVLGCEETALATLQQLVRPRRGWSEVANHAGMSVAPAARNAASSPAASHGVMGTLHFSAAAAYLGMQSAHEQWRKIAQNSQGSTAEAAG
jgi:hypothetical protein